MSRFCLLALLLTLLVTSGCVFFQENIEQEVSDFVQLLVANEDPSLAEYEKFNDECGGETELTFALRECRSKGWQEGSSQCIDFTNMRCQLAEQEPSFALRWLRNRFSTAGKTYKFIGIESRSEGFNHDLIEVEIGNNRFLLFHNTSTNKLTGLSVGVSKVNGKKVSEYLE